MEALKKYIGMIVLGLVLLAMIPMVSASDAQVVAVREMENLPSGFSPLAAASEETDFLRSLIGGGMYRISADGKEIASDFAVSMEDVTAEYAGVAPYGVPADALRGYAYRIVLSEEACWDDGTPITADDWIYAGGQILASESSQNLQMLANAQGYATGKTHNPQFLSLAQAGYGSVTQAQEVGITDFYVDVLGYWGVGDGWVSADSRTRIRDHAMPAGRYEMYVSGAWLYKNYLAEEQAYAYHQTEFVGIAGEGVKLTQEDVGLVKTGDYELVLILQEPETQSSLKVKLVNFTLLREGYDYRSPETTPSCGPYRVKKVDAEGIWLEENSGWWGEKGNYQQILCR